MNIVVTLPASVEWAEYEKELEAARDWSHCVNFKVANMPKSRVGDRCYVVHRGFVRGWMEITGFSEKKFTCTTTGRLLSGKFVERSGPFHRTDPVKMKGFQGFRYYNEAVMRFDEFADRNKNGNPTYSS